MKSVWIGLSLLLFTFSCSNRNTPENVAEDFVYNYYLHADQEAALLLSHSLAQEKLKAEIERLQGVRGQNGSLEEQRPQIKYEKLGKKVEDNNQIFFRYRLTIKNAGTSDARRNAVILTELIDGRWKIVNFDEYSE